MMTVRLPAAVLFLLAVLGLIPAANASTALEISQPWVREAPPGARVMAGYLNIRNGGAATVTVMAISSPDYARAEIHRTVVEDGIARMQPVEQLEIPADSAISLEPGGLHLMLFEPGRPLQEGDTVTLIIHRADGACMTVEVQVKRDSSAAHAHHHH